MKERWARPFAGIAGKKDRQGRLQSGKLCYVHSTVWLLQTMNHWRWGMTRSVRIALVVVAALCLAQLPASGSGSVGPGGVKASTSASYSRGKALTFRNLVCRQCPIQKGDFNRERARAVKESVDAALAGRAGGSEADNIRALCADDRDACADRLTAVQYFLQRRYKL